MTTKRDDGAQRENLGWLASGGQLPRKRKPIENVSHGSLVYLEAEKAKARSEKAVKGGGRLLASAEKKSPRLSEIRKRKKEKKEGMGRENAGVEDRNARDEDTDAAEKRRRKTMLEKKAKLYEKLRRGDRDDDDDDDGSSAMMKAPKDGFDVDFRRKRREEGDEEEVEYKYDFQERYRRGYVREGEEKYHRFDDDDDDDDDDAYRNEEERRRYDDGGEEEEEERKRDEERRLVEDVAKETVAARREAEEAKMDIIEAREALKRKYIEEKIAKVKEKKRMEKEEKKKKGKEKK